MKIIFIALMIGLMLCANADEDPGKYLENINVEDITKDEVFLKKTFACFLDKEPCGDLQYLKDAAPMLIASKCSDCTDKQKNNFNQLNKILQDKYPEQYKSIVDKFSKNN